MFILFMVFIYGAFPAFAQDLLGRFFSSLDSLKNAVSLLTSLGTLRYEDGKARTATAVDAGNLSWSRRVAKNKLLKMCVFAKDGDVNII